MWIAAISEDMTNLGLCSAWQNRLALKNIYTEFVVAGESVLWSDLGLITPVVGLA